jgi:hypothetical protein
MSASFAQSDYGSAGVPLLAVESVFHGNIATTTASSAGPHCSGLRTFRRMASGQLPAVHTVRCFNEAK